MVLGERGAEMALWEDRSRHPVERARKFPHDPAVFASRLPGAGRNDPPRAPQFGFGVRTRPHRRRRALPPAGAGAAPGAGGGRLRASPPARGGRGRALATAYPAGMTFSIPDDLAPELYPLSWLVGTWRGYGILTYGQTVPEQAVAQEMTFDHDGGPYLRQTSLLLFFVCTYRVF